MPKFKVYLKQTSYAEVEVEAESIEAIEKAWDERTELSEVLVEAICDTCDFETEIANIEYVEHGTFDREYFIKWLDRDGCLDEVSKLFTNIDIGLDCENDAYEIYDEYCRNPEEHTWEWVVEEELKIFKRNENWLKPNYKDLFEV